MFVSAWKNNPANGDTIVTTGPLPDTQGAPLSLAISFTNAAIAAALFGVYVLRDDGTTSVFFPWMVPGSSSDQWLPAQGAIKLPAGYSLKVTVEQAVLGRVAACISLTT